MKKYLHMLHLVAGLILTIESRTASADPLQDELDKSAERARYITTDVREETKPIIGGTLTLLVIDPLYSPDQDRRFIVIPVGSIVLCTLKSGTINRLPATCDTVVMPDGLSRNIKATIFTASGEGIPVGSVGISAGLSVTVRLIPRTTNAPR